MAGKGKRMRPHTLTTAKPLLPVGGKPIVQRLVEDITKVCGQKVEEIALPKEEEKVIEKPTEKPFVPFFSPEQLKRIFGKKD